MNYYLQTKNVDWLSTPKDTIWVEENSPYIQPEEVQLRTTLLGVNLDLLNDDFLFKPKVFYNIKPYYY